MSDPEFKLIFEMSICDEDVLKGHEVIGADFLDPINILEFRRSDVIDTSIFSFDMSFDGEIIGSDSCYFDIGMPCFDPGPSTIQQLERVDELDRYKDMRVYTDSIFFKG